ncbi:peptidoglycan D,D-transpeptidase FtsI family protein [Miltoncostaea marina]|uniref:peptidoglycan D,D-transpeptidase FtsI family protein n=1 Tax=Miltoncostaea marina TaxID=2843215 RepID=UPI001C3D07E6|nr:penicillin-binding protein 2 [Miltoncostaea marina]
MPPGTPRRPTPRRPPRRPASRPKGLSPRDRSRRIRLLALGAIVLMVALGGRAFWLGTVRADDLSSRSLAQSRHEIDLLAQRGSITARDGTDLATDRLAVDVTATPNLITDPQGVAARLGPVLRRDPNELANTLAKGGTYAVLARNVTPAAADRARDLGIAGIHFADTYQRFYPGGMRAAQLLGLTGDEHQGISGLERSLDETLTGTPGRRVEVRDVFQRPIQVLSDTPARRGSDVKLTIDPVIQDQMESTLAATREKYEARSAMAIAMDPRDGSILAMATVPRYNPNRRQSFNADLEANRPVTDTFEPGSTFKIVTMAGALEDGVVEPTTLFHLPPVYKLYDRELEDAHERGPVSLTASQILEQSSNIGTVKIAELLGKERIQAWIERFGFGSRTGIDYPGEVEGLVLPADRWSGTSILNIPIGQGIGVSLIQLTRAFAAVANGGTLVQPHVINEVDGEPAPVPAGRRIMTAATARQVDGMLRKVVSTDGTAELAQVKGYEVAGKTGTANKIDPDTGEYSDTLYTSSFVGYVPADDPQLLVAVVVDEPSGAYYGGDVAAPAFEEIAELSLHSLRILP